MAAGKGIDRSHYGRARAAAEIVFVLACVVFAEWGAIPLFGRRKVIGVVCMAVVFGFGCWSQRSRRESARDIGFGLQNFGRALLLLLFWMIPAAAVLLAIGWALGSLHLFRTGSWGTLVLTESWLLLWGLMQQYALQAILNRRFQELWGKGAKSIIAVALVFSVLHLPNLPLTAVTLTGGLIWAWAYQKAPNLLALGLSHNLMTIVLASCISQAALHGLRVGYNYF